MMLNILDQTFCFIDEPEKDKNIYTSNVYILLQCPNIFLNVDSGMIVLARAD